MKMSELPASVIHKIKDVKGNKVLRFSKGATLDENIKFTKRDVNKSLAAHNKKVARDMKKNWSIPVVFGGHNTL